MQSETKQGLKNQVSCLTQGLPKRNGSFLSQTGSEFEGLGGTPPPQWALEGPPRFVNQGKAQNRLLILCKTRNFAVNSCLKIQRSRQCTDDAKKKKQNKTKQKNSSRAPHEKKTMLHVFCLLWRYAKHRSQEVPIATMGHYSILNEFLKNSN